MILTCPECSTRYLMSSAAIGADGREVRCAKCAHEWFQEPDEDVGEAVEEKIPEIIEEDASENIEQEEESVTDDLAEEAEANKIKTVYPPEENDDEQIPESVKPDHQKTNVPAFAEDVIRPEVPFQAKMMGYAASLTIFALLIIGGLVFKQKIVTAWAPASAIYELAGFGVSYKGEDLVMEELAAEVVKQQDGADVLILKGRVMNLTGKSIDVPKMVAVLRSTNGEDGAKWIIDPPVDQVEAGASFAFTSEYAGIPGGIGSVNLTFVPEVSG